MNIASRIDSQKADLHPRPPPYTLDGNFIECVRNSELVLLWRTHTLDGINDRFGAVFPGL